MTDIVDRLKMRSVALRSVARQTAATKYDTELNEEAAAEIESLRKERDMAMEEVESIREAYDQERRMREFAEEQCLAARAKAMEEAATLAADDDGNFWWSGTYSNMAIGQRICTEIAAAIRALALPAHAAETGR